VISSTLAATRGSRFMGMGRAPAADPDVFGSYEPGMFWSKGFFAGRGISDTLLVPMDSRTTAGPCARDEYGFYREGGLSWSIPYVAGVFTLAAQVRPLLTPGEFWTAALKSGKTIRIDHEGKTYSLGAILDPGALILDLQTKG
jgi:hypothetical protein